jgi:LacI family transcriptional regulator, repressor for deo operon, udp, cdd, tsx, nupC, and nupG
VHGSHPRLSEVAELAGVSTKTVSNVLNAYPHVSEKTRLKVESALQELDYRVNLSARSLASGRTGFIALAVPGLRNPYFADLAGHVIKAAAAHRWAVLIEQTGGAPESETSVVGGTLPYLVDGILLHPEALTRAELLHHRARTPIVLIGERSLDQVTDHVSSDNVAAAREVTRHLLQTGRRRIAVAGIFPGSALITSSLRYEGYASALAEASIDVVDEYVVALESFERGDGAAAAARLMALPEPPDALLCFNDIVAAGALSGLTDAGVRVPGDLAVAGFDGIDETAFTNPPITTVAWDTRALAEQAVALLADPQGADDRPSRVVTVGYELLTRRSTA